MLLEKDREEVIRKGLRRGYFNHQPKHQMAFETESLAEAYIQAYARGWMERYRREVLGNAGTFELLPNSGMKFTPKLPEEWGSYHH